MIANATKKLNNAPKKDEKKEIKIDSSINFSNFEAVENKLSLLEKSLNERTSENSTEEKKILNIVNIQMDILDKIDVLNGNDKNNSD